MRILLRSAIGLRLDKGPSCFFGFGSGTRIPLPTASSGVWVSNMLMVCEMVVEKATPTYFNSSFWFPSVPVLRPFCSDFGVTGLRSGRGSPVKGTSGVFELLSKPLPNGVGPSLVSAHIVPSASCTHSGGGWVVALMAFTAWNMCWQLAVELISVASWSARL